MEWNVNMNQFVNGMKSVPELHYFYSTHTQHNIHTSDKDTKRERESSLLKNS